MKLKQDDKNYMFVCIASNKNKLFFAIHNDLKGTIETIRLEKERVKKLSEYLSQWLEREKEMIKYIINLSFDLGKAVEQVGDVAKNLNNGLAKFGIDGRLIIRSQGFALAMEVNRKLKKEEKSMIAETVIERFNEATGYDFKVESFQCEQT